MSGLMTEIISLLFGGLTASATAIGGGLSAYVTAIFATATVSGDTTTYALTTFGGLIIIFAGISLAIGLSRWVLNWVTSFGN